MTADQPPGRGHGHPCSLEKATSLVTAWQQSQQPMSTWCREHGILRSAMHSYLRRMTRTTSPSKDVAGFIQLRPCQQPSASASTIRLTLGASGATAELSVSELSQLLQTLAGSVS